MIRPTAAELAYLLESTTMSNYQLLCLTLGIQKDETVDTTRLLQLCLYDWLTEIDILKPEDRQRLVLVLKDHLRTFAEAFDHEEQQEATTTRPQAALAIADWRYIRLVPPLTGRPVWAYDLLTGEWVDIPNTCPLTNLACDLSVLLLRLLGRMTKARRLTQESKDAAASTATDHRNQSQK